MLHLVQQGILYKKFCTRFFNSFSPGLEVFIDMDMYMLTDQMAGISKHSYLKENYVIAWDSCVTYLLKYQKRRTWN